MDINNIKLAITGMGYVGLPLAVAFSENGIDIIGFDINQEKINKYKKGEDPTSEIGKERLAKISNIKYTSDENDIKDANFHIVAVPTPVGKNNVPDLDPVTGASRTVGRNLKEGSIVVYESTVYPGVTEEVCVPILEEESDLICGEDFKVGYSPERVNPGDKVNTVETIVKVVSGMDEESLDAITKVYEMIIKAGVHRAPSIKVAEASKIIENSQRDVNIAFMNELSMIFDKMDIDTQSVLEAAGTKWNFLNFYPGLVGGHCIGVDPYYLTYRSEELGYISQLILNGRRINDQMSNFVAEKIVKKMIESNIKVNGSKVLVMGATFKENVPDLRNSKVADLINQLEEYHVNVKVTDPIADSEEAVSEHGIELQQLDDVSDMDTVVVAVNHEQYNNMELEEFKKFYKDDIVKPVFIDIKSIFDKNEAEKMYNYWRM
ncbi:nucleotide sugar dehydrogenase [Selenihalanaerobacter shriftii]|uniref:UDP-N-acetyl-D-galactosamine dehydrogenase n=1 Tax=Selenihalanaerobacter shriftii TaxID=142842 RepID=A0A1T4QYV1_9FIRM|nr:nucleotide sugar dehydrogenase [Selenihalanaerobacter shriftii]SKA08767.1 UDP-N-acetyl-D-galactosamine dehydrogenase [Selenihalanaerobacter shriftii]